MSASGPSRGTAPPWPSLSRQRSASLSALPTRSSSSPLQALRNTFVDNILRRATNTQAAALRRRAAKQLFAGHSSAPFLALLGVSLASGTGIVTKEDEVECVCGEIRQAAGRVRLDGGGSDEASADPSTVVNLNSLDVGSIIAKECARQSN